MHQSGDKYQTFVISFSFWLTNSSTCFTKLEVNLSMPSSRDLNSSSGIPSSFPTDLIASLRTLRNATLPSSPSFETNLTNSFRRFCGQRRNAETNRTSIVTWREAEIAAHYGLLNFSDDTYVKRFYDNGLRVRCFCVCYRVQRVIEP